VGLLVAAAGGVGATTQGLILALLGAAWAQAPPPVVGGSKTSDWTGVGALLGLTANQDAGVVFCTGALIATDRVLTAAHCGDLAAEVEAEDLELWFATGADMTTGLGDELARIDDILTHPDYDDYSLAHDIAVLVLDHGLDGEVLGLNTSTVGSSWEGRDLWHVGFGITGWNKDDIGVKREVMLPILGVDATHVDHYDPGGDNLCLGDSGGPAIDPDNDTIVGVASYVWAYEGETLCDDGGSATARVDIDVDWITEALDLGGDGENSTTLDVSEVEPSSGAAGQLPPDETGLGCALQTGQRPGPLGLLGGLLALGLRRREEKSATPSRSTPLDP